MWKVFFEERAGRAIRATLILYVAIRYWRLHRRPPKTTWMSWSLMAAAWAIVVGEWLSVFFLDWGLDGKHLVFVGGFSLLAFLVAARVTLAHGEGLDLETKRWPYFPLALFILLASFARTSVHWTPESYFPHLAYAGVFWITGAMVWAVAFLPKLGARLFKNKRI